MDRVDHLVAAGTPVVERHVTAGHTPAVAGLFGRFPSGTVGRSAIPVRAATRAVCAAGIDPLCVLGSGALLATMPDGVCETVLEALDDAGIGASVIGRVHETDDPALELDGKTIRSPNSDAIDDLQES